MTLNINSLSHSFNFPRKHDNFPSVTNLSLKAVAGEITVLLGGSGCGKTTILNLIAGLLTPSAGIIELETNLSLAKVERVGFVFQTPTLIPWLSVRDNALFATLISGTPSERIHAEADRLLDEFGIASVKNAFPRTLSGGMQQRVALIRAVLSEAPVLLLDEPFSNSDLVMRRILHEELRKGVRGRNLIALLVTHDVADAALLGDNIYVLTPRPASVAFSIRNPMSKHDREFLDKDARRQLADLEHLISQKLLATTNGG